MFPKKKHRTEFECQECKAREEMLATMPRAIDPVFTNARRRADGGAKERAIEITACYISLQRLHIEQSIAKRNDDKYVAVDLAEIEADLQNDAQQEIMSCIVKGNRKSFLDAGEADERSSEPDIYKSLNQLCFERFMDAVHNRRNGSLRSPRANQPMCETATDPAAIAAFEQVELDADLLAALSTLSPEEREIFKLRHSRTPNMTYRDIAIIKGLSEGIVGRRYNDALKHIKRYLDLD